MCFRVHRPGVSFSTLLLSDAAVPQRAACLIGPVIPAAPVRFATRIRSVILTDLSQKMFSGGSVDSAAGGSSPPAHRPVTPAICSQHSDTLGAAHTESKERDSEILNYDSYSSLQVISFA